MERETRAILLLQSRPETVWSAKEAAPAARAGGQSAGARDVDLRRQAVTLTADGRRGDHAAARGVELRRADLEIDGVKLHLQRAVARRGRVGAVPSGSGRRPSRQPIAGRPRPRPARATVAESGSARRARAFARHVLSRAASPARRRSWRSAAQVEADTIVGIIEVMKLMNTVRAGVRGTVREILARDGDARGIRRDAAARSQGGEP